MPELKIADYLADEKLLLAARADAREILDEDPGLSSGEYQCLRHGIIDSLPADYLRSG